MLVVYERVRGHADWVYVGIRGYMAGNRLGVCKAGRREAPEDELAVLAACTHEHTLKID